MTAVRAALVRTESIGDAGVEMGYEPLVRMSRGEKNGSKRAHAVILADCFEAVIGAIYLDQGYATAAAVIQRLSFLKRIKFLKRIAGVTLNLVCKKFLSINFLKPQFIAL